MTDAIEAFAAHVAGARAADMGDAVPAAKTFILDTIGVGIVGFLVAASLGADLR